MSPVDQAREFATLAHDGQYRKYTGEAYISHPIHVAGIVASVPHTSEMLQAALLHDVVEDTWVTQAEVSDRFGQTVSDYVDALTERYIDGLNRAGRKAAYLEQLSKAPAEVQTIKMADIISNTASIVEHDPNFAVVYLKEKQALVDALVLAAPALREQAQQIIDNGQKVLTSD